MGTSHQKSRQTADWSLKRGGYNEDGHKKKKRKNLNDETKSPGRSGGPSKAIRCRRGGDNKQKNTKTELKIEGRGSLDNGTKEDRKLNANGKNGGIESQPQANNKRKDPCRRRKSFKQEFIWRMQKQGDWGVLRWGGRRKESPT